MRAKNLFFGISRTCLAFSQSVILLGEIKWKVLRLDKLFLRTFISFIIYSPVEIFYMDMNQNVFINNIIYKVNQ